jgi:glycosyltransferase involved in cell wall biosynthesis
MMHPLAEGLPPLTYLSFDSVCRGVGLSQVARYVERLARRGVDVTLHSFEPERPTDAMGDLLAGVGVQWHPHRFGRLGAAGGAARAARGAFLLRGAELVHARSDVAAASSLASRRPCWIWDVRGFWRRERVLQDLLRPGSPPDRVMAYVEGAAARSSTGIIILSNTAADVLRGRFGAAVSDKIRVIPTCVDLSRFPLAPMPETSRVRLLLLGTLNRMYDVPVMLTLLDRMRAHHHTDLQVVGPPSAGWGPELAAIGATSHAVEAGAIPDVIREHHVGLCVQRGTNLAAMPTKVAEFLATGRPVVIGKGLGDLDDLLTRHDCGVIVGDSSERELDRATDEILRLVFDPETPARCRRLAEEHFDLERGVDRLLEAYRRAVDR